MFLFFFCLEMRWRADFWVLSVSDTMLEINLPTREWESYVFDKNSEGEAVGSRKSDVNDEEKKLEGGLATELERTSLSLDSSS